MACWFEYNGKRYEPDELVGALKAMPPTEAAKYIPGVKAVPEAPFQKSWHELALKDAIHEAASKGLDRISWTPGEAQAARYDLSKTIDKMNVQRAQDQHGPLYDIIAVDKKGNDHRFHAKEAELDQHVGKEMAKKIIENKSHDQFYQGLDLKVGGEGMKGFYDKIIPDALNKIGKPHGVRVKEGTIKADNAPEHIVEEWAARDPNHPFVKKNRMPVHYMDIPQSLKDQALKKGFSLFEDSSIGAPLAAEEKRKRPKLTPVDHNPFDKRKLIPVDHNPFQ